ncbi:MAG: alpha/beta hydrolase [Alphaproteobacteria bacterium]|nr:alpha/beta hydrolase [Alphaproteobacteria bacterium]
MFEGFERQRIDAGEVAINAVIGGRGPPLLLLHGYPQSHVMWRKVAPALAERFTVVAADLRGYGDSDKPAGDSRHETYCKRRMAQDQVDVMAVLGHERFQVAGHDRGGRVVHRMCLDHPGRIQRAAVLDIVPTHTIFANLNKAVAFGYYHWFFLSQPYDLPERLIGAEAEYYLERKLGHWSAGMGGFDEETLSEYRRCFRDPATIHASCEDYRAAATIDLEHDQADFDSRVACPLLVLWGAKGLMHSSYDVLDTWRAKATDAQGRALDCGHFLPEEAPAETLAEMLGFFEV